MPIQRSDGTFATRKQEQADLIFEGTIPAMVEIDLSDVPEEEEEHASTFDEVNQAKILSAISKLAVGKAPGLDQICNKTLKLACLFIQKRLARLYNAILFQGTYPRCWKEATTVIMQKANKTNYTSAKAYRPIALLNTTGKILELIIACRLTEWVTTTGYLPETHFGGRNVVGTEEALLELDTWTWDKWKAWKTAAGLTSD